MEKLSKLERILMREVMSFADIKKMIGTDAETKETLITLKEVRDLKRIGVGKNSGYFIRSNYADDNKFIISPASKKTQKIKFAFASDFHSGCEQFDIEGLDYCLGITNKRGYEHVYISGDLTDGVGVYKGQNNNLVAWKVEDQVKILSDVLSRHQLHYRAIGGNHDYSFEERGSINPGKLLATSLPKFEYLGPTRADLLIAGVAFRMVHGAGGSAYALSYPGQKYLRNLLGQGGLDIYFGDDPHKLRIVQLGHYHTHMSYSEYGIEVVHPGNFQKGNDFTERRGLRGQRGLYLCDFTVDSGKMREWQTTWLRVPSTERNN